MIGGVCQTRLPKSFCAATGGVILLLEEQEREQVKVEEERERVGERGGD